jgi:hypothetical protein
LIIHSGASWLSNFAPFAAIALCGAAYFPRPLKFALPLAALFLSDIVLNHHYDAPLFSALVMCRYLTLVVIGLIGLSLENRASFKTMLPASIAASALFYGVTCTFAWLSDPGYAKNFAGLFQSLTVGLTTYSATPSWMFFRNSLVSDLAFTFFFVLCVQFSHRAEFAPNKSPLPRPA